MQEQSHMMEEHKQDLKLARLLSSFGHQDVDWNLMTIEKDVEKRTFDGIPQNLVFSEYDSLLLIFTT